MHACTRVSVNSRNRICPVHRIDRFANGIPCVHFLSGYMAKTGTELEGAIGHKNTQNCPTDVSHPVGPVPSATTGKMLRWYVRREIPHLQIRKLMQGLKTFEYTQDGILSLNPWVFGTNTSTAPRSTGRTDKDYTCATVTRDSRVPCCVHCYVQRASYEPI